LSRIAEDGFFHLLRLNSGALDCCPGGYCADVSRGERGERTAEFADRRAHR
jgi:hypothetical protein